jgi:pectinesterase
VYICEHLTLVLICSTCSSSVDFVFGQHALVFITQSTIRTIGDGYITASGRSEPDDGHFVIDRSIIKGYGKQYLGRPWK